MKILHMYCTRSRSSVVVPGAVVQMTCGVGSTAPMFVDNAKLFLLICRYVITRWLMKKKKTAFSFEGKRKKGTAYTRCIRSPARPRRPRPNRVRRVDYLPGTETCAESSTNFPCLGSWRALFTSIVRIGET